MICRTTVFPDQKEDQFLNETFKDTAELDASDMITMLSYFTTEGEKVEAHRAELIEAFRSSDGEEVYRIVEEIIKEIKER